MSEKYYEHLDRATLFRNVVYVYILKLDMPMFMKLQVVYCLMASTQRHGC